MSFLLCITSCQNQLNLVWEITSERQYSGWRWTGGKSLERRGEVFVFVLKTEVVFQIERRRPPLHCHCTASEMTVGTFSTYPCYVWPFVDEVMWIWQHTQPYTLNVARILFSWQWWTGDGSFTACLLSVDGAVSRCFSKSLTRRLNVPTLESLWSHVTETHLGLKIVVRGSCWILRMSSPSN